MIARRLGQLWQRFVEDMLGFVVAGVLRVDDLVHAASQARHD